MSQVLVDDREQQDLQEHANGRLSTARGIEREIEKLSEVFSKFATLVVDQGESLRVIDADIEAAAYEVEDGQRHIAKTHIITKGNRGVIVKIFATVVVLAVILVTA
jgi:syntaxin 5